MAIFTRRVIQRCLDESAEFASQEALQDWVARLNTVSDDYVATEWEVALLWAFAQFGNVLHEPKHGQRPIDLFFESRDRVLQFAADIVAISDRGLHEKNPISRFQDELWKRIYKAKIQTGGFFFKVEEQQPIPHRGTKRKRRLLLPPASEFSTYIFNADFETFLERIRNEPHIQHTHYSRHPSPAVAVMIQYLPGRVGVATASYGSYTSTTVKDDNPLFNALRRKAAQLKQSAWDGIRGVIVCDGGSRMFNEMANWATFNMTEVIREFFRTHHSVDFVVILGIKDESLFHGERSRHRVEPKIFVRSKDADWLPKLEALVPRVTNTLPSIQQSPENAINEMKWNRSTIYTKPYLGGSTMEEDRIQMSAREFLDLLAGRLDQKRFMQNHDAGGGKSIFSIFQAKGKMITGARLERRPDEDDDLLILEFGTGDPAVSPFRVPKSDGSAKARTGVEKRRSNPGQIE
jgi:hypothetical protein